jgi:hypothetical protein
MVVTTPGSARDSSKLTGIPELVLMPAPVTTTTFFALNKALAMSCKCRSHSGLTCMVGIFSMIFSLVRGFGVGLEGEESSSFCASSC